MEKLTPEQLDKKFEVVRRGGRRFKVTSRTLYSKRTGAYERYAAYDSLMHSPSSLKDSVFTFRTEAGAEKAAKAWEIEMQ